MQTSLLVNKELKKKGSTMPKIIWGMLIWGMLDVRFYIHPCSKEILYLVVYQHVTIYMLFKMWLFVGFWFILQQLLQQCVIFQDHMTSSFVFLVFCVSSNVARSHIRMVLTGFGTFTTISNVNCKRYSIHLPKL